MAGAKIVLLAYFAALLAYRSWRVLHYVDACHPVYINATGLLMLVKKIYVLTLDLL